MNNEGNKDMAHRQHVKYFMRFLNILPSSLSSHDTTRVTIAYFSVAGLDVLGSISAISLDLRSRIIEWLYRLQVHPDKETGDMSLCGFQGSSTINIRLDPDNNQFRCGHLAMTYTGLCILLALGDDLSRINRTALIQGVKALQTDEGNFSATLSGCESDMRFVYCAACISYILNDWSGFDIEKATDYVIKSIGYDYGIAQCPELESHGGTTFCALATLALTDQLDKLSEAQIDGLKRWLVYRQIDGFQGRPNKPVDTCYSFWVGASLKILNALQLTNYGSNRRYVYETQDMVVGGFSKWPDTCTDPMHTYLGLSGLSLIGESGLLEIEPRLNITKRAYEHLKCLHEQWVS
ncbi:geranylgeranyltransferase type I beta subunit [Bombyx mori]|uniref:Geranylgeranyl transferase type-1 subunit beta n=1 Tax=Bombyx mori TaxID=7091 RepID=D6RVZ4_BOMMO|nr:geranylgeranyltransferase type I beta subunit [Bombyx mori]BAJ09607.1 geranylgeranyltransferase type I beta subunit [Bombyx mori]